MATWGKQATGNWGDHAAWRAKARGRLLQAAREVEREARDFGDVSALIAAQNCISALESGRTPSAKDRAAVEAFQMADVA